MDKNYRQIFKLGTILGIWAHPDDESWCAGGVLAAAVANGQRVVCITATKGEAGMTNGQQVVNPGLAAARQQELQEALKVLGVTEHHWLDYHDGHCHEINPAEPAKQIAKIMEEVKPDTIITFGPDGLTGHQDHKAVSGWATAALGQAKLAKTPNLYHKVESKEWYLGQGKTISDRFNIYYKIDQPPLVSEATADLGFKLPPELIKIKLDALRVQTSQTNHLFSQLSQTQLSDMFGFEGFQIHNS